MRASSDVITYSCLSLAFAALTASPKKKTSKKKTQRKEEVLLLNYTYSERSKRKY